MHPFKVILPRFHPSDLDNAKALAIANDYGFACSYLNEILASLNFYRINFKDEWLLRKELPMFVRSSNTSYPVLAGIMLPLVMFWGESTGYMPLNDFEATENGELPQYGTCSAFVVKCFKITGWICPTDELARGYAQTLKLLDELLQHDSPEDAFAALAGGWS